MQLVSLNYHPATPCALVHRLNVEVERPAGGTLRLGYVIQGNLARLRFPEIAVPSQRDKLWQHTCFEAFLKTADQPEYYEFNFAPSSDWALYRFSGYRNGMTALATPKPPAIVPYPGPQTFRLEVCLDLNRLDLAEKKLDLALSAVMETREGALSYWALRHPSGQPDFHHPEAYAIELAPAVILEAQK